jgi:hypothetical protein
VLIHHFLFSNLSFFWCKKDRESFALRSSSGKSPHFQGRIIGKHLARLTDAEHHDKSTEFCLETCLLPTLKDKELTKRLKGEDVGNVFVINFSTFKLGVITPLISQDSSNPIQQ